MAPLAPHSRVHQSATDHARAYQSDHCRAAVLPACAQGVRAASLEGPCHHAIQPQNAVDGEVEHQQQQQRAPDHDGGVGLELAGLQSARGGRGSVLPHSTFHTDIGSETSCVVVCKATPASTPVQDRACRCR
jgi:hypothetical protein